MTKEQAEQAGYSLIKASSFEVGLIHVKYNGVRTWWASDFDRKMPELDHPIVMKCIEENEEFHRPKNQ